jgi:hypothetical protein
MRNDTISLWVEGIKKQESFPTNFSPCKSTRGKSYQVDSSVFLLRPITSRIKYRERIFSMAKATGMHLFSHKSRKKPIQYFLIKALRNFS